MDSVAPYVYEPFGDHPGDAKRRFRVLKLKPWGVRVPITRSQPNLAPDMPSFPGNPRHDLQNNLQTRELRIIPPKTNAKTPLEGVLEIHDIESPPKYEALSWAWGTSTEKRGRISLMNASGQGNDLPISTILHNALKALRHQTESRTLWIDQICINQEDYVEREQQVQHMTEIYQTAEQVYVYLGPEENDSQLVPFFIESHLKRDINRPANHRQTAEEVRRWNAFAALMRRTWFTQRW